MKYNSLHYLVDSPSAYNVEGVSTTFKMLILV